MVSRSSCADLNHSSAAFLIKNPPLLIHLSCEHAIPLKEVSVHRLRVNDEINRYLSLYVPQVAGHPLVQPPVLGGCLRNGLFVQDDEQIHVTVCPGSPPHVTSKENDLLHAEPTQALHNGLL